MPVLPARQRLSVLVPLVGVVLLPNLAAAQDPPAAPGLGVEVGIDQDPAIYGGTAAQPCGWPTAVFIGFNGWACSGTLVHPDIVITAAHCPDSTTGRQAVVSFGEGQGGGARNVGATCYSNPNYDGGVGASDYGYCRLSEPVNDVPIIPPAWGCDTSGLAVGREVVIVGFGQSDNGGSGSKREVTTTITAIGNQAIIGGNGEDACQGDSGGPVYIKLKSEFGGDDTWRAFGITSGGGECGQGGIFSLMHQAIPWIESHSDVDITPCHDSDGDWEPTPECGGIPLDPANGVGNWGTGCSGGPVSGFSALCGDPFGSGEDPNPPTVDITSPASGTVFMLGGDTQINITIDVSADDGDGFGVASVALRINGQDFPGNSDNTEPYSWGLVFVAGGYIIEAVATDYVGNESVADVISIGIDQEAPPLPGGDGDGDDGDSGGDGDGDPGDGDSGDGDSGDGDTGPLTSGGETGFGGFDGGGGKTASIDCACSTPDGERGGAWGVLGVLGIWALRRRR